MRKLTLLIVLITWIILPLFSQTQRLVLIEEATNASCGPCAGQNPDFDILPTLPATMAKKTFWM